jgi:DNA (cytosine-5)-methyltransferase 1
VTLRYGSVCSGIEAATLAWRPLGWRAEFYAEIADFPNRVLAHHYPETPNHGDFTKISGPTVDLLVGGTPCQSFSVAGLGEGLDDPRGGLALQFLRLAQRTRARWVVWENVPGVLSNDEGRAFGSILGGLAELGYGFAYRVLDAQYVRVESHARAVPQRRRRVFVVGHSGGAWQRAAAVLFERASLSGDPPPRREAGEGPSGTLAARTRGGGGLGTDHEFDGGLVPAVAWALQERDAKGPDSSTKEGHLIPIAFAENSRAEVRLEGGDGNVAGALSRGGGKMGQGVPAIAFQCHGSNVGPPGTLRKGSGSAAGGVPCIAFHMTQEPITGGEFSPSLGATSIGMGVHAGRGVRRLTPRECERLMGMPDDYTLIPGASDGPRYAALGNSMAVNVMRWIGERIAMVDAHEHP